MTINEFYQRMQGLVAGLPKDRPIPVPVFAEIREWMAAVHTEQKPEVKSVETSQTN